MKYACFLVFVVCIQGILQSSQSQPVRIEDNSIYFKKGIYREFFNDRLSRLREIQSEYPQMMMELSLYQLESEPRSLAVKRCQTLIRSFQEAGLDMNRIVFDSRVIYVPDFKGHPLSVASSALDSVGAVLEGRVVSLD